MTTSHENEDDAESYAAKLLQSIEEEDTDWKAFYY